MHKSHFTSFSFSLPGSRMIPPKLFLSQQHHHLPSHFSAMFNKDKERASLVLPTLRISKYSFATHGNEIKAEAVVHSAVLALHYLPCSLPLVLLAFIFIFLSLTTKSPWDFSNMIKDVSQQGLSHWKGDNPHSGLSQSLLLALFYYADHSKTLP